MPVLAPTRPISPHLSQSSPVQRQHAVLPADPRAIAGARGLVRTAIRRWDLPVDEDTAILLVSELVTNAVTHGPEADPVALTIDGGGGQLRVEVHDTSVSLPVVAEAPAAESEHGRGLLLVDMLAETWGWQPTAAGKTVYFTLAS